jgi:signal transduction histidine kinase
VRLRSISARKLEVAVADQGLGIPPSALRGVFQRFHRLAHDGARPTRGLGLGLYIVRNVIRAHRGEVHAESEGAGRGSRFVVTLPGQLDEAPHPAR